MGYGVPARPAWWDCACASSAFQIKTCPGRGASHDRSVMAHGWGLWPALCGPTVRSRLHCGFIGFGTRDGYIDSHAAAIDTRSQACGGDKASGRGTAPARHHPFREPRTRYKSSGERLRSSYPQRATARLRRGLPPDSGTRTSMRRRSMYARRMAGGAPGLWRRASGRARRRHCAVWPTLDALARSWKWPTRILLGQRQFCHINAPRPLPRSTECRKSRQGSARASRPQSRAGTSLRIACGNAARERSMASADCKSRFPFTRRDFASLSDGRGTDHAAAWTRVGRTGDPRSGSIHSGH